MARKPPDMASVNVKWAVTWRRTNTGMGSEYQQQVVATEMEAKRLFGKLGEVRFNVDIELRKITEVRVSEIVEQQKMTKATQ